LQWCVTEAEDQKAVQSLAEALSVTPLISKILCMRGICDFETARSFFRPLLSDLNDPFLMADMEKAVIRIEKALELNERIFIYGDYDVDGITAASILILFLRRLGADVIFYIPDRLKEGYGLTEFGIEQAIQQEAKLMITVDCGITAVEEVEHARKQGLDIIISDHHEPAETLPKAVAILDPKRAGCSYPFKELAGVGVAFKLIQAVTQHMEMDPDLPAEYLDLVALGSAADIVPLIDENRILAHQGLEKMNLLDRIGIRALTEICGLKGRRIGTGQLVFIMAPRINAVGRLGNAEQAVHLMVTDSKEEASHIAQILDKENQTRKYIDEETFNQAQEMMGNMEGEVGSSVVLAREGWHSGVIGIVASRIVEKVYRPTVMIAIEDGVGKGSARSIPNFNVYSAIKKCEKHLIAFGGHKYAAGLTIDPKNIKKFTKAFHKAVDSLMEEDDLVQRIYVDAEIALSDISEKFVRILNRFAPFGPKNMRPVFQSNNLQVVGTPRVIGRNHLKFRVQQKSHVFDAIGFGLGHLYDRLSEGEANLDMVYVIEENVWNGQARTQLRVKDLR